MLLRKYFSDVVSCLEYLRSKGTCHGDIKAKTILISSNGRAFLADSFFINGGKISY
jgi:serine/threonine protein kinase